jgi:hypothetical protein
MIFFLFIPWLAFAHVIQDDVSISGKVTFDLSYVCQRMVSHQAPLIDIISGTEIDCMGKRISVANFCEQELAQDPYYLRGYVMPAERQVACLSGKKVIFKYLCVKLSDQQYCGVKAAAACSLIQAQLARRLQLVNASFTSNSRGIKQLNCYFDVDAAQSENLSHADGN